MELFGMCFYMWQVLLAVYVVGIFIVGYPIGKYSIIAWALPTKHPVFWKILFPINGWMGKIGRKGFENDPDTPYTIRRFHRNYNENKYDTAGNSRFGICFLKYLIVQMLIWPLRLTYIIVVGAVFGLSSLLPRQVGW